MHDKLFLIVGATASGKSTVLQKLHDDYQCAVLPTYRDRDPRTGETSDYANVFLAKHRFSTLAIEGYFDHIELIHSRRYGFKLQTVHNRAIASMSPSGAAELKQKYGCKVIKLMCETKVLQERIRARLDRGVAGMGPRFRNIQFETDAIANLKSDLEVDTNVHIETTINTIVQYINVG